MKTSDLRIGNLVYFENEVQIVSSLHSDNTLRLQKDINSDCHGCYKVTDERIKPIPLTEEWMLKFNFPKDEDNIFKLSKSIFWLDTGFMQVANGYTPLLNCECKYVHQLQNFYYCIFNKELTLK